MPLLTLESIVIYIYIYIYIYRRPVILLLSQILDLFLLLEYYPRLTEKLGVKNWLMPAIPDGYLDDQFGFRPTGIAQRVHWFI